MPEHLAIIMDGNGRWAKKRFMPRSMGHRAGAAKFKAITRYCSKIGIKYLTVYAFSTENWKRPEEEVGALMGLFKTVFKRCSGSICSLLTILKFVLWEILLDVFGRLAGTDSRNSLKNG